MFGQWGKVQGATESILCREDVLGKMPKPERLDVFEMYVNQKHGLSGCAPEHMGDEKVASDWLWRRFRGLQRFILQPQRVASRLQSRDGGMWLALPREVSLCGVRRCMGGRSLEPRVSAAPGLSQ